MKKYLGLAIMFIGMMMNVYLLVQGFGKFLLYVGVVEPDYGNDFLKGELSIVGFWILLGLSVMFLGYKLINNSAKS